jgi:hypothetical protein
MGVGFSAVTTANSSPCYGAASQSVSRIEFAVSGSSGASFGSPVFVGGQGSSECPYFQDIEPSFAVDSNGEIFAAYVGANATRAQMTQAIGNVIACPSGLCAPIIGYYDRPASALLLAHSTNNGASFSSGAIIQAGGGSVYTARPQVATIGSTVYVVYENVHNSTTPLGGQPFYPSQVLLTVSHDYGASWGTPIVLPGLNNSGASNFQQHYTSLSPSISVNPSGEIAVSYATNRSCIAICGAKAPGIQDWGEEIVVTTSTNNGTTWSPLHDVGRTAEAEYAGYGTVGGANTTYLFENGPSTSVAWNPLTSALYVAWSGAYNLSGYDLDLDYGRSSVFAAASTNGGASWSSEAVVPPMVLSPSIFYEGYYDPAIAEFNGTVYLTYSYYNSSVPCGCGSPLLSGAYSQWVVQSPDGVHWSPPILAAFYPESGGVGLSSYEGYTSSIAFDSAGNILVAGALATAYDQVTGGTEYVQGANVTVATLFNGPSGLAVVSVPGLPTGQAWSVGVNGNVISGTGSSLLDPNTPLGVPLLVDPMVPHTAVSGEEYNGTQGSLFHTFSQNSNLVLPDVRWAGVSLAIAPDNLPYVRLTLTGPNETESSISQSEIEQGVLTNSTYGCDFPWYLPVGARVTIANASTSVTPYSVVYEAATADYAVYWNGTGSGSFTGLGASASLTVEGPINETLWILPGGTYNLTVGTPDLPPSATAHFSIGEGSYNEAGGAARVVHNLTDGVYDITNLSANATSGWQYYGRVVTGNPVPVPDVPEVNLTFAYVHVAAAPVAASFVAGGLPDGTAWSLEFNGSVLSSSTPWINLTAHPGRYPVVAFPSVGAQGTTAYAPSVPSQEVIVSPGAPVTIPYVASYLLTVIVARGGSVTPGFSSEWVPEGQAVTLLASNSTGWAWDGWSGSGAGAFAGMNRTARLVMDGPVTEAAAFYPQALDRFNATIEETGLPAGDVWTVFLGGAGHASNSSEVVIPGLFSCQYSGSEGRYPIEVSDAYGNGSSDLVRFVPASPPVTACGGARTMVTFQTQYYVSIGSSSGGSAAAIANGSIFESGSGWYDADRTITLVESADSSFAFQGWTGQGPGSYTGTAIPANARPEGPIEEAAQFLPAPTVPPTTYTIHLRLGTTLDPGTVWTVTYGDENLSSAGSELNISGVVGDVTLRVGTATSPTGLTRYDPVNQSIFRDVSGNQTVTVAFVPSYWLLVEVVGSGTVQPGSEWAVAGAVITLTARPLEGFFEGWAGNGTGSYTGPDFAPRVTVLGPLSEVATFVFLPAATASTGPSSAELSAAAVVLLLAGAVVGLLLSRRGRPRPPAPAAPEAEGRGDAIDDGTPGPAPSTEPGDGEVSP